MWSPSTSAEMQQRERTWGVVGARWNLVHKSTGGGQSEDIVVRIKLNKSQIIVLIEGRALSYALRWSHHRRQTC